jgi:NAD(P) transhydrogenase subunit alpha
MIAGVPQETAVGELRVALTPESAAALIDSGTEVAVQSGAGQEAGYSDEAFRHRGVEIVSTREALFDRAEIILQVRTAGANPEHGADDLQSLRQHHVVIGLADPLDGRRELQEIAAAGVSLFAMELIPRITRAQSMDVLSSMATIAGYKAVLQAAVELPRMFPLLMTAAGTLAPARVLVIGAGVAGLQAIATAKRLGGVIFAYDVRPAVKEQVESLGAQFVELDLQTDDAEDAGGYARAQDADFYSRQQQALGEVVAECDVVVTTAAIPGKPAPILITAEAVRQMRPGSIIFDLAAERGGNCALTKPGETTTAEGVKILAPFNVPSTVPFHASQMYGQNISTFLRHLLRDGELHLDDEDEITTETLVTRSGQIVHSRVNEAIVESQQGK